MTRKKLRKHVLVGKSSISSIHAREAATSIGLGPFSEEYDGQRPMGPEGWPVVVLNPILVMKKGTELTR